MDGVLTDTSGITTNKFYVYTDERKETLDILFVVLDLGVR